MTADAVLEWANWAHLEACVPIPRDTPPMSRRLAVWRHLPAVAKALGRDNVDALGSSDATFLDDLDSWYERVRHTVPVARTGSRGRLAHLQLLDAPVDDDCTLLTAAVAHAVVTGADHLFAWAHSVTGLSTPDLRSDELAAG